MSDRIEFTKENLYDIICDLECEGCVAVKWEPAFQ